MIIHGDCLDKLKEIPDNSVDAIITDPPYGLSFMGKKWDYDVPSEEIWKEALRVLKPGGHVLSFCGTRTYHRMVVRIEDAGFEIRDQIQWIYGSGFPKSHDVSKGIDKAAGATREVIGQSPNWRPAKTHGGAGFDKDVGDGEAVMNLTAPSTEAAKQWQGWGTALKPANEPICLARKPLEGTVAQNVLKYGTGAINVDAGRIGTEKIRVTHHVGNSHSQSYKEQGKTATLGEYTEHHGRWPANVLFDEEAAAMLDEQSGTLKGLGQHKQKASSIYGGKHESSKSENLDRSEQGGASRFFYVAKASKRERNDGLEGMPDTNSKTMMRGTSGSGKKNFDGGFQDHITKNNHPTVKPIKLMEYLIKLITPPNGTVLDPFMGSGSTGVAAKRLGFSFIGIERESEYVEIAERRVGAIQQVVFDGV